MPKIFRTLTPEKKFPFDISYNSKLIFIGSCFTENIGNRMQELKFQAVVNPFGIMYNPISVKRALQHIAGEQKFTQDDLIYHNELWHSMHHHGIFSRTQPEDTLNAINSNIEQSAKFLQDADYIFITFGTAWVYELKKNHEIVANCHKLPKDNFTKRMLDADEILIEYFQLIKILNNINPKLKIIFTISPLRHLSNGQTGNFFSKSTLAVAVNQILNMYEGEGLFYFPAYEILHDDLRDYRFYAEDMIHPSEAAVDYIFDYFKQSFFSKSTCDNAENIRKIIKSYNHRPFNTDTTAYAKFKKDSLQKIIKLKKAYPQLDFEKEEGYFSTT